MAIDFQPNPSTPDIVSLGAPSSLDNIWDGGGSMMAWINARSYGAEQNEGVIFWASASWFLTMRGADTTLQFLMVFSGGNFRWRMPTGQMTGNLDEWHHVAVTYDAGSTANDPVFYFDGDVVAATEIGTGSGSRVSDVGDDKAIGRSPQSVDFQFDGGLADARMYDRILSAAEIKTIASARGRDGIVGSLVGRWLMDEQPPGTAATGADSVRDSGPFGNHGTPGSSPLYAADELSSRRRMR